MLVHDGSVEGILSSGEKSFFFSAVIRQDE